MAPSSAAEHYLGFPVDTVAECDRRLSTVSQEVVKFSSDSVLRSVYQPAVDVTKPLPTEEVANRSSELSRGLLLLGYHSQFRSRRQSRYQLLSAVTVQLLPDMSPSHHSSSREPYTDHRVSNEYVRYPDQYREPEPSHSSILDRSPFGQPDRRNAVPEEEAPLVRTCICWTYRHR